MGNQSGNNRIIEASFSRMPFVPFCGGPVYIDDGYSSMEMQEYCVDRNHYRIFMNLFGTSIVVGGKN
ncbi:hypothetical protein [Paenibacillus contaminans]|uniref:hypothetical protein n=1 Tax=Paenibacillus contaminans TaxID=450362 RepID=UPI0011BD70B6|nr:hypothetical protein [Paenibacillus contaminans]